jgi:predicted nuclease of predicted toxin-antitoxin system
MKILVDMNLSPDWVPFLAQHGSMRCTGRQSAIPAHPMMC